MRWADYERFRDLAGPTALAVYHFPDRGVIVRRRSGWYAANDTRWQLVGEAPNSALCQPARGPHATRTDAAIALLGELP